MTATEEAKWECKRHPYFPCTSDGQQAGCMRCRRLTLAVLAGHREVAHGRVEAEAHKVVGGEPGVEGQQVGELQAVAVHDLGVRECGCEWVWWWYVGCGCGWVGGCGCREGEGRMGWGGGG